MTNFSNNILPLFFSILLPGAGHIMSGKTRKGSLIMFGTLIHVAILILAWERGKLAWLSDSEGGFSTGVILAILLCIWVGTLSNLWRESKRINNQEGPLERHWYTISHYIIHDKKGLLGVFILVIILYTALFAPFFAPYDPMKMDLVNTLVWPSRIHFLGTDNFGRDILSRLIYGSRIALEIGAGATLFNMILGGFLGLIGGYLDRKSTRLNSSHTDISRMPSSA